MLELPDFRPLRVVETSRPLTRAAIDSLDHLIVALPRRLPPTALQKLLGTPGLDTLYRRAVARGHRFAGTRLANTRATGVTAAHFDAATPFAALTWARQALAETARDQPRRVGCVALDLPDADTRQAMTSLVAAADAAAFDLPTYKSKGAARTALKELRLWHTPPLDLAHERAAALGNNLARWFTALPPNELDAPHYRRAIRTLAAQHSIRYRFLSQTALERLGAGAFLAVARGNATAEAGIVHLSYQPERSRQPALTLVGKGILFDTGGTNLKPFKSMLDMHMDMQGSAVALGTLLALAELRVPYRIDAWLALTENRLSPSAYKPQDVVRAADGTSIQVIHTDAEGRMVLADTLALAARDRPAMIIDYATLTGTCIVALTELYTGVFTNRATANSLLLEAGAASGERVWPFPMDDDFDELLKSDIADVKQCSPESHGDHILAARFLRRFVPAAIPWIHVDLSAGQHKGGLAHVPTEITGFGVRLTLALLDRHGGPAALAARLPA